MSLVPSLIVLLQKVVATGAAVVGVGFIIGFHELGHFLFCKIFGISTPTFSIGMGPKLFSKKILVSLKNFRFQNVHFLS